MTNAELLQKIERLEKENRELKGIKKDIPEIPTFSYSKIKDTDLRELFDIKESLDKTMFDNWFDIGNI